MIAVAIGTGIEAMTVVANVTATEVVIATRVLAHARSGGRKEVGRSAALATSRSGTPRGAEASGARSSAASHAASHAASDVPSIRGVTSAAGDPMVPKAASAPRSVRVRAKASEANDVMAPVIGGPTRRWGNRRTARILLVQRFLSRRNCRAQRRRRCARTRPRYPLESQRRPPSPGYRQ